jgi:hypothetical protein
MLDYRALPGQRPLQPLYRAGTVCPGCGHKAWHVGHHTAECGRCGAVLAIAPQEADRG